MLSKAGVAVVATGAIAGGVTVTEHRRHQQPPAQTQQARGADAAGPPAVRATGEPAADGADLTGAPASAATPIAFGGVAGGGVHRDRDGGARDARDRAEPERDGRGGDRGRHRDGGAGPERADGRDHRPATPAPATPSPPQPADPSGGRHGRHGDDGRPATRRGPASKGSGGGSHAEAPAGRRDARGGSHHGSPALAREKPQRRDPPLSETHGREIPALSPSRADGDGDGSSSDGRGDDGSRGGSGSSGRGPASDGFAAGDTAAGDADAGGGSAPAARGDD